MRVLSVRILTLFFISCLSLNHSSYASNNFCDQFLEPLRVRVLMDKVDWQNLSIEDSSVTSNYDVVVFDRSNVNFLSRDKFPTSKLGPKDRVVETAYGYAIIDVDQLRDWQMLASIIQDPPRARAFIEKVANTEGYFPNGITRESAEWLRWSVFAQYDSERKASNKFNKPPSADGLGDFEFMMKDLEYSLAKDQEKREIFRRLVRQKNVYIFPFGLTDVSLELNEIREEEAVVVLKTLSRYFMLSKLLVKRPSGEYVLISEIVGNDALILFSRHPKLIPLYPLFEDGHFEIPREYVIGHQDTYTLATKSLIKREWIHGVKYSVNMYQNIYYEDDRIDPNIVVSFDDYSSLEDGEDELLKIVSREDTLKLFSEIDSELSLYVARKTSEFRELTGVNIPEFIIELKEDIEIVERDFALVTNQNIDPVVYTAFLMFMALDNQ